MFGDWFATVVFWRPQVALFVSKPTLLPVFVPFAPAASRSRSTEHGAVLSSIRFAATAVRGASSGVAIA